MNDTQYCICGKMTFENEKRMVFIKDGRGG
jgi:hypothetical protein